MKTPYRSSIYTVCWQMWYGPNDRFELQCQNNSHKQKPCKFNYNITPRVWQKKICIKAHIHNKTLIMPSSRWFRIVIIDSSRLRSVYMYKYYLTGSRWQYCKHEVL